MFTITHEQGAARTGRLQTRHGSIETPAFLEVATKGNPKLITMGQMEAMGAPALICNSLLLHLRPGNDVIRSVGGLHAFFGWNKAIFTDSGGFQSISPGLFLSISKRGIHFRNPFTLQKMLLTPHGAIKAQQALGGDAAYCLDYMPPATQDKDTLQQSVERTTAWAEICKKEHHGKKQLLAGIAQGGSNARLRTQSSREIGELGFDILAIGGMGIGERPEELQTVVNISKKTFPKEKPVHLMGVGSPVDIVHAVSQGVDLFDSCYPTRMGRHGAFFTGAEIGDIGKKLHERTKEPLDPECACYTCTRHSTALLHHLFKVKEQNAQVLLSLHNVHFVLNLMKECRHAISENRFKQFSRAFENKP